VTESEQNMCPFEVPAVCPQNVDIPKISARMAAGVESKAQMFSSYPYLRFVVNLRLPGVSSATVRKLSCLSKAKNVSLLKFTFVDKHATNLVLSKGGYRERLEYS